MLFEVVRKRDFFTSICSIFHMWRGSSWALDDITVVADDFANGESVYQAAKEHSLVHKFEILLTFGKVDARVTSKKVKNGSSTGTGEHRHDDL